MNGFLALPFFGASIPGFVGLLNLARAVFPGIRTYPRKILFFLQDAIDIREPTDCRRTGAGTQQPGPEANRQQGGQFSTLPDQDGTRESRPGSSPRSNTLGTNAHARW